MKGKKIKTLTSEFWLSNWKALHAAPHLCSDLLRSEVHADQCENSAGLLLDLLPSPGPVGRKDSLTRVWVGHPSMTNICNIQYMLATSHPFWAERRGGTCPAQACSHRTDLLLPTNEWEVRPTGEGGWSHLEQKQPEQNYRSPSLRPLLWQLTLVHLHKRNSPPCQVCRGTGRGGAPSSPTPLDSVGALYWAV